MIKMSSDKQRNSEELNQYIADAIHSLTDILSIKINTSYVLGYKHGVEAAEEEAQREKEVKVGDEIYSPITETYAVVTYIDWKGDWHCVHTRCKDHDVFKLEKDKDYQRYWKRTGEHITDIWGDKI